MLRAWAEPIFLWYQYPFVRSTANNTHEPLYFRDCFAERGVTVTFSNKPYLAVDTNENVSKIAVVHNDLSNRPFSLAGPSHAQTWFLVFWSTSRTESRCQRNQHHWQRDIRVVSLGGGTTIYTCVHQAVLFERFKKVSAKRRRVFDVRISSRESGCSLACLCLRKRILPYFYVRVSQ